MTIKEIAISFSNGEFEKVYNTFSDNISWRVTGESLFTGKSAVVKNCDQTAAYFKTVKTNFLIQNIVVGANYVAINVTAEFIKESKCIFLFCIALN